MLKRDLRDAKEVDYMISFIRGTAMKAANTYMDQIGRKVPEKEIPKGIWIELTKQQVIRELTFMYSMVEPCTEEEVSLAFDRAIAKNGKIPYIEEPGQQRVVALSSCLTVLLLIRLLFGGGWLVYRWISSLFIPKNNPTNNTNQSLILQQRNSNSLLSHQGLHIRA